MFGFLKKFYKHQAVHDVEQTMLQAYLHLENAKRNPDVLLQRAEIVTALAALLGAIRDALPRLSIVRMSLLEWLLFRGQMQTVG